MHLTEREGAPHDRLASLSRASQVIRSVLRTPSAWTEPMLKYIELKSGFADNGPAWIAHVKLSKSGRTVYFNGHALKRAGGDLPGGNHYDLATAETYWVSGVKKNGADRHWAGSGRIAIEKSAVAEYLRITGRPALDRGRFIIVPDFPEPDPTAFTGVENAPLDVPTGARRSAREEYHPRTGRGTKR